MPIIDPGDDLVEQKNKLEPDGAWVWLLRIKLSATEYMRLARNAADVTFLSETWRAFPFNVTDIKETADGELATMNVLVEDVDGAIGSIVRKNDGLSDREVIVYKLPHDLAATPTDGGGKRNYLTWSTTVQAVSYSQRSVVFQLSGSSLVRIGGPAGIITRDACPYVFKDPNTCQYSGSGTFCDKSLDGTQGCLFYNNVINYGGSPGIPKQ